MRLHEGETVGVVGGFRLLRKSTLCRAVAAWCTVRGGAVRLPRAKNLRALRGPGASGGARRKTRSRLVIPGTHRLPQNPAMPGRSAWADPLLTPWPGRAAAQARALARPRGLRRWG